MTKPVILSIDDEPQVLNAIERDLRRHYHRDYRIMKADTGASALETVQQLKRRDTPIALFLVDQVLVVLRRHVHRPLKFGERFSRNAACPSLRSSVVKSVVVRLRS